MANLKFIINMETCGIYIHLVWVCVFVSGCFICTSMLNIKSVFVPIRSMILLHCDFFRIALVLLGIGNAKFTICTYTLNSSRNKSIQLVLLFFEFFFGKLKFNGLQTPLSKIKLFDSNGISIWMKMAQCVMARMKKLFSRWQATIVLH